MTSIAYTNIGMSTLGRGVDSPGYPFPRHPPALEVGKRYTFLYIAPIDGCPRKDDLYRDKEHTFAGTVVKRYKRWYLIRSDSGRYVGINLGELLIDYNPIKRSDKLPSANQLDNNLDIGDRFALR